MRTFSAFMILLTIGLATGNLSLAQVTITPGPVTGDHTPPATATPETVAANDVAATMIGPDDFPDNINPLTGLPVDDPTTLDRRPIVAKISNAPPLVRPQAGVGTADLVFEHYAEGGLTRFSAVYYGGAPDRVGSVRSGRLIDYELSAMYRAVLAFSGGSTGVEERIFGSEALGIVEARQEAGQPVLPPSDFANRAYKGVIYGPPYYWRDESVPVPHNLFTNPNALWELATNDGINTRPELRGMAFDEQVPAGATGTANLIDIRYRATRAQWFYDAERGQYLRVSDGQPHFDANTGERVAADNVVVIYARHDFTDIVESEWQGNKSYSIEIRVWFEGDAAVFRNGQWYDARWERPTRESMMSFYDSEGNILPLKPGQTWFQLVRLDEQRDPNEEWVRIDPDE